MLVGTNTVAVDDPHLTVRDQHGVLLPRQPLRAVMGERALDPRRRIFDDGGGALSCYAVRIISSRLYGLLPSWRTAAACV